MSNSAIAQFHEFILAKSVFINAYSSKLNDAVSGFINNASLAGISNDQIALYGEERYLLKEFSSMSVFGAFKTRLGNFGIETDFRSFGEYNHLQVGGTYAKQIDKKIDVALQVGCLVNKASELNKEKFISAKFAMMSHPYPNVNFGFQFERCFDVSESLMKIDIPSRFGFGFGYDVSDNFCIGIIIDKESGMPVNVSPGLIYMVSKKMNVRFGFSGDTKTISSGVGFAHKDLDVKIFFNHHPQLGITPGVMLSIYIKNKHK